MGDALRHEVRNYKFVGEPEEMDPLGIQQYKIEEGLYSEASFFDFMDIDE